MTTPLSKNPTTAGSLARRNRDGVPTMITIITANLASGGVIDA
jgi:hypothetical protein